jgi:hypothetical protein
MRILSPICLSDDGDRKEAVFPFLRFGIVQLEDLYHQGGDAYDHGQVEASKVVFGQDKMP